MQDANDNIAWAETQIALHEKAIEDLRAYKRVEQARQAADTKPPRFGGLADLGVHMLDNGMMADTPPAPGTFAATAAAIADGKQNVTDWREVLNPGRRGAKKLTILDVLAGAPEGLQTIEIVNACISRGLVGTTMQNTGPQLHAYNEDDLVKREGTRWKITSKGRQYMEQKI